MQYTLHKFCTYVLMVIPLFFEDLYYVLNLKQNPFELYLIMLNILIDSLYTSIKKVNVVNINIKFKLKVNSYCNCNVNIIFARSISCKLSCVPKRHNHSNEPVVLSASILGSDTDCNGNSTGSADLTVNGGTTNYTYLWSNGGTTATITGLTAGLYSVVVTDANGCGAIQRPTVTLRCHV